MRCPLLLFVSLILFPLFDVRTYLSRLESEGWIFASEIKIVAKPFPILRVRETETARVLRAASYWAKISSAESCILDLTPRSSLLRRSSHFGYEGRKLRGIRRRRINK